MSKHMSLEDRIKIQASLEKGKSLNEIAKEIGKARTTVSREIQKHFVSEKKGCYGKSFNECIYRYDCRKTGICENKPDCITRNCRFCKDCNSKCGSFKKETCSRLLKPPYVCNGCDSRNKCTLEKRIYRASVADREYRITLTEAREGFNLTEEEFHQIDMFISERIEQGHSIYNIVHAEPNAIPCSESTMYRLVGSGLLRAKRIDLPRAVRFKTRKGKKRYLKIDRKCTVNRKYEDFISYTEANPDICIAEMDSVEGTKGGKVLLTIIFRNCSLMLAFLRDRNTAQSVIDIFDDLYSVLGHDAYKKLFSILLGDNGTEFSNPLAIEFADETHNVQRSKVFYCHPSSPFEKGLVENNHEFIRKFIPKGHSFDDLSQEDVDKMMSHINSYGRPKYNGLSPAELFIQMYGIDMLHLLRQELIPPEKIFLNSKLFHI